MARKNNLNSSLFSDSLYTEGFKNDETPLDEYTLNKLVDGVLLNKDTISQVNSSIGLNKTNISLEEARRKDKDKAICLKVWEQNDVPTSGSSIKSQLDTLATNYNGEATARRNADISICRKVWGQDKVPESGSVIQTQLSTLSNRYDNEVAARTNADISICRQVWGQEVVPTGDTIKKQLDTLSTNHGNEVDARKDADSSIQAQLDTLESNYNNEKEKINTSLGNLEAKNTELDSKFQTGEENRKTYDQRITGLDTHDIPNDYENSNEKLREMIDAIPSGGGGGSVNPEDLEGYATEEWVKGYVDENAGAIVYLNTKQHIGRNIELQDVYPIQAEDTLLKVISKNRVKYIHEKQLFNGVEIKTTPEEGIKVTGQVTNSIDDYFVISETDIDVPGKYTLSVYDNDGIENENKKCYITYTLHSGQETGYEIIRNHTRVDTSSSVVIDTKELGCSHIKVYVFIFAAPGQTFNTSASQTFKVQLEYGDKSTDYTPPKDESNIGCKQIEIYGRNLCIDKDPFNILHSDIITINGKSIQNSNDLGTHYATGIITTDNIVEFRYGDNIKEIHTPLLIGDEFTFIYNVDRMYYTIEQIYSDYITINNLQIVYGHTDYEDYHKPMTLHTESLINGTCDITNIQYPYSFLSLKHSDEYPTDGYTLCISYDPALSRDWTEKQLESIDSRINDIETKQDSNSNALVFDTYDELDAWVNAKVKNICPPPESRSYTDGDYDITIETHSDGKFTVSMVQNGDMSFFMEPLFIHSVTLHAGTYTASSDFPDMQISSNTMEAKPLPYTFTLDKEQTMEFGTYSSYESDETGYIQVELGNDATDYAPYCTKEDTLKDGLTINDIKEGTLLLIKDTNTSDYWWAGSDIKPMGANLGDIEAVLDELHNYAQTLISGEID